ncbi:MAG: 50S ribosomal protein L25/general stress protein Ctc [Pseudomonadota bacterium]|jgi:large subunit ribosomal protein L25
MAEMQTLAALKRIGNGKGPARASRRAGNVPAVIYGGGEDPQLIALDYPALMKVLNRGAFMSHQFMIDLGDGAPIRVIPRDIQLDPVRDLPLHVDFLRLVKGSTIRVNIPVHFSGEAVSPGLKKGGVLNIVRHEIELICPVDTVPEVIECDLSQFEIGDSLHISGVNLPEGVVPAIKRDFTIATVVAPAVTGDDKAAADGAAPEAAPAAAGKAAPAAAAKAPAAGKK